MRRLVLTVVILGFVALVQPANAAAPRIALVIGNSAYQETPLANPANDARLMAETLRGLGFVVIERIDADRETMQLAAFELQDRLVEAGADAVGLFACGAGAGATSSRPASSPRSWPARPSASGTCRACRAS